MIHQFSGSEKEIIGRALIIGWFVDTSMYVNSIKCSVDGSLTPLRDFSALHFTDTESAWTQHYEIVCFFIDEQLYSTTL